MRIHYFPKATSIIDDNQKTALSLVKSAAGTKYKIAKSAVARLPKYLEVEGSIPVHLTPEEYAKLIPESGN